MAGARTRYWAEGEGPIVVLVHGYAASVEMWPQTMAALAPHYRVLALDLLGSGLTDKPVDAQLTPRALARFTLAFLDALHIERAAVVGHSMGGGLALELALAAPERVNALGLVACTGLGGYLKPSLRLAATPILGWFLTRPGPLIAGNFLRSCVHDTAVVTDELVAQFSELGRLPGTHRCLFSQLRQTATIRGWRPETYRPIAEQLHTIQVPTLLVWGRQDRIVPFTHSSVAVERLPDVRLHTFEPCGHLVQLERPGEFEEVLLDFLQAVSGASGHHEAGGTAC
ncbi:MAG: alpha/beta fold hydrolase [Chloroflexi bacterium]|nr:alpha/beta fold hydrolase [Chloroflexota bacterium]